MTDDGARTGFRRFIEAIENADPGAADGMPKPPDTAELVGHFPELAKTEVSELTIDGPHGEVPARLYRHPGTGSDTALVWMHGGGFIGGDLLMPEAHWVGMTLAARGIPVLSVDYRKCIHGVHFPIPSDDVLAAWLWAVGHTDELGRSAERLHLGGASAGANLAAGVTKRLRDGPGQMPASLVLAYPALHAELPPPSDELMATLAKSPSIFTPEVVREISLNFVGSEEGLDDPYAFPGNGDVSGQPPIYVLNSEADTLRGSGEAYAAQLLAAGVSVTVEFEPGSQHGHLNSPYTREGQRSIERMERWLRAASGSV